MSDSLAKLLATAEPADLGPGPRAGVLSKKSVAEQLDPLLEKSGLEPERQELIRALILLWHDHLDEAHSIAQSVETAEGAFVHGIMHRREPDFGNAAYWFRRVGQHPAYEEIATNVAAMPGFSKEPGLAAKLIHKGQWEPFEYINACAEASRSFGAPRQLLRAIQRIEFSALLDSLQS